MDHHIIHNSLGNESVLDKNGSQQYLSRYDTVLLYFSAHWCPPCREFTPRLKSFYEKLPKGSVKIVFVSWDKSDQEFLCYFHQEHGNWLAVNFSSTYRQQIGQKFGIEGIPSLRLIDNKNGSSCLSPDILRGQIGNPSTKSLEALKGWEDAAAVPYRLPLGTNVNICFLKSKPELNGQFGTIVGWKEKRCIVNVGNTEIALKRENLFPKGIKDKRSKKVVLKPEVEDRINYIVVDANKVEETIGMDSLEFDVGTPVVLTKLSTTKWNGESGVIQNGMEEGKYLVYMNSREILKIKKSNLFI